MTSFVNFALTELIIPFKSLCVDRDLTKQMLMQDTGDHGTDHIPILRQRNPRPVTREEFSK
ncbi:hypothetical protein I79_010500 [Cricetulus griseus]|uniref:Uncharacterized protein n=1 Tax=Cricetulus griseus TaxID=10029 RepID=G3HIM6_CRIGR|nr:hypothetical protein I79_010500 [Cricetulus griseus]